MAKKHKHEEHVNHERWVISFADMMTLLFALFVVLYAIGQQDLTRLKAVKNSIQWALHITGEGKTKDVGIFDNQTGGGDVMHAAPLVTAQDGEMREFLKEVLPEYQEVAGKSLRIDQTDDAVSMSAPLSDFFEPDQMSIKRDVANWLNRTVVASVTFASDIHVAIETPDVPAGKNSRGQVVTSGDVCMERLKALRRMILHNVEIREHMVETRFRVMKDGRVPAGKGWEDVAVVRVTFSNTRPENR
jgi:hypothetical protein